MGPQAESGFIINSQTFLWMTATGFIKFLVSSGEFALEA
jgi:hypothetical protein